jgi:D-threonate/D-erythronate kinase
MTEKFIYIADDLTGACDVASFICDYAEEADVVVDYDEDKIGSLFKKEENPLNINFVISTNSRDLNTEDTVLKLEKLGIFLREFKKKKIFKKIDSAFRGNVVLEINTLMNIFNKNICFLINSIPSMGRITLNGFQLIKGKILSESEFNKDPVKSVASPFIPFLFTENNNNKDFRKAAHINLEIVRYGDILGAVENAINNNINIISFDSATNKDIEKIVSAVYEKFDHALYAGTLGLLEALHKKIYKINNAVSCKKMENTNIKSNNLDGAAKNKGRYSLDKFIGFTSSKYKITKKQLAQLQKKIGSEISKVNIPVFLKSIKEEYDLQIMNFGNEIIKKPFEKGLFVVAEFKGKKEPENLSVKILKIISDISFNIMKNVNFGRLILIGGETGLNILKSMEVKKIRIKGRITDGISYGVISDGMLEGKQLFIKGGSVGNINSIIDMVNFKL